MDCFNSKTLNMHFYTRGRKVKHFYFPTSLAARIPDMVCPMIRCTHLKLSLRTESHRERGRTFVLTQSTAVVVCSGAGNCSHLPNPAGSFLSVPNAAVSLAALACDVVPRSSVYVLFLQPSQRFCELSIPLLNPCLKAKEES